MDYTYAQWPDYTAAEVDAVRNVLLSKKVNYWTGCECRSFEHEFARWVGVTHAVALSNGTVALELALNALNIGQGDEVIVTSRTFIASAACIVLAGAVPVFADVDPDTQNIHAASILKVVSKRIRAIICVHLAGWPCDMDPILEVAKQHDLFVIEDCAQAHGAIYNGRSVGSIGHIAAWSFCQDKIISTGGEGGMITTNDTALWKNIWSRKDHGKSWDLTSVKKDSIDFQWIHESIGTNARMTEMQAAIGRIQLDKMHEWHSMRVINAHKIWDCARELPGLRVPEIPNNIEHAAYKCYIFVRPEQLAAGWSRSKIISRINKQGVPCFSGTCSEIYLEQAFARNSYCPQERLPVARLLGETSIMFPVHPTLTADNMAKTCRVLREVMLMATNSVALQTV